MAAANGLAATHTVQQLKSSTDISQGGNISLCVFCFIFDRCFRAHVLDDKSTAQTKVQIQIVEQLEQQLQKVRKNIDKYLTNKNMYVFDKQGYICNSYKM